MAEWSKSLGWLEIIASLETRHRFESHSVSSIFRVFVSFLDQDIHNECLNTYTRRFLQITELFSILINKLKAPNLFTNLKLLGCIRQIMAFIRPHHVLYFCHCAHYSFLFRERASLSGRTTTNNSCSTYCLNVCVQPAYFHQTLFSS